MPNDIPLELIEKSLALTGKTIHDMTDYNEGYNGPSQVFSIEKFCYYLLSPEFIERYNGIIHTSRYFGEAIYSYQKGNPEPLISLLSKI